jgi:hypothetical protein
LVNLLPLARGLRQRGHRVVAALRDLSRAEQVFEGLGLVYFQASVKIRPNPHAIEPQRTFAHILHNNGFGDAGELKTMADAWRNLISSVRPDLIVFDHSPTALLAARGLPVRRALIGTGFFCPADEYPLPDLRPGLAPAPERLKEDEDSVLSHANGVLASWGQPPLARISQLYNEVGRVAERGREAAPVARRTGQTGLRLSQTVPGPVAALAVLSSVPSLRELNRHLVRLIRGDRFFHS